MDKNIVCKVKCIKMDENIHGEVFTLGKEYKISYLQGCNALELIADNGISFTSWSLGLRYIMDDVHGILKELSKYFCPGDHMEGLVCFELCNENPYEIELE